MERAAHINTMAAARVNTTLVTPLNRMPVPSIRGRLRRLVVIPTIGRVPERLPQANAFGKHVELVDRSWHGMSCPKRFFERFFLGFEIPQAKFNSFEN
jgi:hypothetical protein